MSQKKHNDYRNRTLTGSVEEMIQFANLRESVRVLKEQGQPHPWSNDQIMNTSKFCNIFREDDKVTDVIFNAVRRINNFEEIVFRLVIYRFFNRIDHINYFVVNQPTQETLDTFIDNHQKSSIMNSKAYQIYPTEAGRKWGYRSIREVASKRLIDGARDVAKLINTYSHKEIEEAVYECSKAWGSGGHFWFLQVILDITQTIEGVFNPNSKVYDGDGGKQLYKLFGMNSLELTPVVNDKWSDKKRELYPYDIEQLCCEYRKWKQRQNDGIPNNRKYKPEEKRLI